MASSSPYWEMQLREPGTDWSMIAGRLKHFMAIEKTLDTEFHRRLVESLDAALVPSKARPGSIAAKIDALIDVRYPGISLQDGEPDARYAELASLGFAAVPELIEHVDDDRLTRALRMGFNNFPSYQLRVGEMVSDLLQGLAGEDLGKNSLERLQGYAIEKKDALAWWKKAKSQNQEAYLVEHAIPVKGEWLNDHILWLIARRFPRQLPAIYLRILDQGEEVISWPVAKLIGRSSLPSKQKLEVFLRAAHNPTIEHRAAALREVRKLDPEKFVSLLLENLNAFPKTPAKDYWSCPQVSIAYLVGLTDDRRVWRRF